MIEHFLDPIKSVCELVDKLFEESYVYIEVPNADYFCLGGLQNAHTYYFTPRTLAAYMSNAGLTMVYGRDFGFHYAGLFNTVSRSTSFLTSDEYQRMREVILSHEQRERAKRFVDKFGLLNFSRRIKQFLQKK